MRFGVDEDEYTLEEIGLNFDVTRERIRQIRQKLCVDSDISRSPPTLLLRRWESFD